MTKLPEPKFQVGDMVRISPEYKDSMNPQYDYLAGNLGYIAQLLILSNSYIVNSTDEVSWVFYEDELEKVNPDAN